MTREQANRRLGFAQLDSSAFTFATRNSSEGGEGGGGGGEEGTSFGPWQTPRRTRCREEPARNESRDRS